MDLELSEDQLHLAESAREFLEAECPVSLVRQVVEGSKGSEELWKKMVELDWPAIAVPESEGGLGLGFIELAVVSEEIGRAIAPGPFLATAGHFTSALRLAGSADQQRTFLGPVARDGMVGTLAVAEASGSFGTDSIETLAEPAGRDYVLRGTKHFVLEGTRADEIVVAARLPGTTGDEGIGLFVVGNESVRSSPMRNLDASRQYATVKLDGARIGPERVLDSPGSSSGVLRRILEEATAVLAAELVGTCQGIFDIVHAYAGQREQFGVKIGSFQAIKHKLADMYVALESARATAYFAALCIAEDDQRRSLAVSTAKASAGDCQKLLAQQAIQTLGGIGYTWEHDMHMYVKRAKASGALFGTATDHTERIASAIGLAAAPSGGGR